VTKDLGHVPASAQELIDAIKENDNAYGLSKDIFYDLNNIITNDTFSSLMNFTSSLDKAT
jgi:hypothetical protein